MATTKKSKDKDKGRESPGSSGEGEFYHIEIRPKEGFETFRTQDVGEKGGIERVAGKSENGSWDTVKWLVSKKMAHVADDKLIADHHDARDLFDDLGSEPKHIEGDRFEAKDRPNVKEGDKPTEAQTKARQENIKNAQSSRHR